MFESGGYGQSPGMPPGGNPMYAGGMGNLLQPPGAVNGQVQVRITVINLYEVFRLVLAPSDPVVSGDALPSGFPTIHSW